MNAELLPYLYSFALPAGLVLLASVTLVDRFMQRPVGGWRFLTLAVLSVGIVSLPLGGLPLARRLAAFCASPSLPLIAVLAAVLGKRALNWELLRINEMRTAAAFGLVAGSALYPMAMGLGPFDPYALGWDFSALYVVVGALTAWWLWRGNRFGLVLLAAIAACQFGLLESGNYWDFLVDPIFFLISLVAIGVRLVRSIRGTGPPVANPAMGS